MNLIKIGQYIAKKRKELGLTQRELAEKLGMSDKSVSKWERGVCLPDVSLYSELCRILGIGLNEFLAGEDISEEKIIPQSEENIMLVATDSKIKQRRLKRTVTALCIVLALAIAAIGTMLLCSHRNYIAPVDKDNPARMAAQELTTWQPLGMFDYAVSDSFSSLEMFYSVYKSGELVSKSQIPVEAEKGMIMLLQDKSKYDQSDIIDLAITGGSGIGDIEIPLPEGVYTKYCNMFKASIDSKTKIRFNEEQPLLYLFVNDEDVTDICTENETLKDPTKMIGKYEYAYIFTYRFNK